MKVLLRWGGAALVLALFIGGVSRLKFDVDVLNLLPENLNSVRGLKLHQSYFAGANDALITVEAADETDAEAAAQSLAEQLAKLSDRVAVAEWRSPFLEDPTALADLLAWIWLNRPPTEFGQLTNRLAPSAVADWLAETRETLATTFSPDELARLGRDPFGLSHMSDDRSEGGVSLMEDSEHRSADGKFRVIHVRPAGVLNDYRDCALWIEFLREQQTEWRKTNPFASRVKFGITGGPAFVAETALGMETDMRRMTPITAGAIALLFLLAHRRLKPLVWLLILLSGVLGLTMALGGLFFGTLNAVSLGFAAILLGVTVDYGLVLYQELKSDPAAGAEGACRSSGVGIAWSAITTATAFASLTLGHLPGLSQLGGLVAIGVLVGAVVMLRFFLPPLARSLAGKRDNDVSNGSPLEFARRLPPAMTVGAMVLIVLPALILSVCGFPRLSVSADPLRPITSEALTVSERMLERMSDKSPPLMLVVSDASESDLAKDLEELRGKLNRMKAGATVVDFLVPNNLLSNQFHREQNAETVEVIASWLPEIRQKVQQAGFSQEALLLTERMIAVWERTGKGEVFPESPAVRSLLDQAFARSDRAWHALGLAYLPADASADDRRLLADSLSAPLGSGEVSVADWQRLGAEVMKVVKEDSLRIALPMVCIVLASLWMAFRSVREVGFCVLALGVSGLLLLSAMSLFGWSWSLLNLPSIPLLLGLGVDYSIHMQLAMRRQGNDWRRAWKTTGAALALCALTTGMGFGALAFSHNQGLGDLGKVCATGVLSAWCMAVLAIPVLRLAFSSASGSNLNDRKPGSVSGPSRIYGALAWKAGLSIVRIFPERLLNTIGRYGGMLYRVMEPAREQVVRSNLLPLVGYDEKRGKEASHRLFEAFGEKLVSLLRFEAGIQVDAMPEVELDWDRFVEAKRERNGVLLVTLHLGNWELGGPALTRKGEKLLVLSNPEPGRGFTDIRKAGRARWGIETLIVGTEIFAFVEVIKRLQEGGIVALLMDRAAEEKRVEVEFFGRPFYAAVAAAELARATGCAILPVAVVREPKGHVLKTLSRVPYIRSELRSPQARQALTQKIMRDFEPLLRQYPAQWFQFSPIWPEQNKG